MSESIRRHRVDVSGLPPQFPTHRHSPEFWEALGRAVATFGFLEETLGKAIYAISGTREIPGEAAIESTLDEWGKLLNIAVSTPLVSRIELLGKHLKAHPKKTIENLEDLIADLKEAAVLRNVICHGSWGAPDPEGRSTPLYLNKKIEKFESAIDVAYLTQLQQHVSELACGVIDTVTMMGWAFPGSSGPGLRLEGEPSAEA